MEKRPDLSRKLFLLQDIDGSKNETSVGIVRELEDKFKQYSWFIGAALMGSNVRGYNTPSSDVDLKLFYNNSQISQSEVARISKEYIKEAEKVRGFKPGQITIPYLVGFNLIQMQKGMQEDMNSRDNFNALLTLKDLSSLAIGERIRPIREGIKNTLSQLDAKRKNILLSKVVDYAVEEEKLGEDKLKQRLEMKEDKMDEFWNARRALWEKRVNTLWS